MDGFELIRRPVTSRNVSSVGWEPDAEGETRGMLEVEFHSGHVYRYEGVPELTYREMLGASSVGKFLRQRIIGTFEEQRA